MTSIHIVAHGDTLWKIAEKYLGDGTRWPEIWELNKATIERERRIASFKNLSGPDLIYAGIQLRLPASETKNPAGR